MAADDLTFATEVADRFLDNIETVVHGKREQIKLVLAALMCGGHALLEDVPGTAKTVLARAIAGSIEGAHSTRIQCTPDLQPTDVTGLSIFNQRERDFEFRPGPVFANVVLVDEINRAMPKTQSALLEAMAEQQVTVDGETRRLADPFLVMATQNPIESEGTYPLPEAQIDRFMLKILIDYPEHDEELTVVQRQLVPHPELREALSLDELKRLQGVVGEVYVDPSLISYAVALAAKTREPSEYVSFGASPRGPISVIQAARALALLRARDYVTAEDVQALAKDAFRHRLVLSYQALAEGVTPDTILDSVLASVQVPDMSLARPRA